MKKWKVVLSDTAETDLDKIYLYIAEVLLEPRIAWRQIERIRETIRKLDEMPERGTLLPDEPWHSRGLRRLIVDNYLIMYEIMEQSDTVAVIAVLYSKRNIGEVLTIEGR